MSVSGTATPDTAVGPSRRTPGASDSVTDLSSVLDQRPASVLGSEIQLVGSNSNAAGRFDLGNLNLVNWKQDVLPDEETRARGRAEFHPISTVLHHPTKPPNPLRASRKPLPALPAPALPKPPPPAYYQPFLDSLLKPGEPSSGKSLWQEYLDAAEPPDEEEQAAAAVFAPVDRELPDLADVPEIFFDESYDLTDESVWRTVLQQNDQDRLSSYIDTIESHLVHEIGLRAPSFFSALNNLQGLATQSTECLEQMTALQEELAALDDTTAIRGLEIVRGHAKLARTRDLARSVDEMQGVLGIVRLCRELVEAGDWSGALEAAEEVGRWWARHDPAPPSNPDSIAEEHVEPLSTVPAFAVIPEEMRRLLASVSLLVQGELSSALLSQLEGAPSAPVPPLLSALRRSGALASVRDIWKAAVLRVVREAMRQHLAMDDGKGLAEALREMPHERFMDISDKVYRSMMDRLKRVKPLNAQLQEQVSRAHGPALFRDASANPTLDDIFPEAIELANGRAAKVLVARTPQHAELSLDQFTAIFRQSWEFLVACEALGDCTLVSLRGVLSSQARAFVVQYHAKRLQASAKLVEEEQWTQVDVPAVTQKGVDLLVSSAMRDPAAWDLSPPPAGSPAKHLSIEDTTFFLVQATVGTLDMLVEYGQLIVSLDLVVTDVMSRIIEYLKSFNSRTCQVVLGAGAMRSAGLKNITAKHLALASQSLSVIVTVIPYVREFIRRHLNAKQAVMLVEFDKLKRDYQEHQYEIHAKLIAIMADRLAVHCGALRAIDWSTDTSTPHAYAEQLVKETATLHKVLSKYLASSTVETIMRSVVDSIGSKIGDEFRKPELKGEDERQRWGTPERSHLCYY